MSALSSADPGDLARVYLEHALAGRGAEAAQTVIDAVVHRSLDVVDLFERVITPAAERVGNLWHEGQISVANEHFVTQLNQKLIAVAGTLRPVTQPSSGRIVLACPPDEQHDTGLRMVSELLDSHGYETALLGAGTPIAALVDYVRDEPPLAVGLSAATPLAIASLAETVAALRDTDPSLPVFLGGRCTELYPAVSAAVGAPACATMRDALAFLDGLRS